MALEQGEKLVLLALVVVVQALVLPQHGPRHGQELVGPGRLRGELASDLGELVGEPAQDDVVGHVRVHGVAGAAP